MDAVVANDPVRGQCVGHQVPNPGTGAPQPAPPMPFSAPITHDLASSVLIGNVPAAVQGSWGLNVPAHLGLHASDPFMVATQQRGTVTGGSTSVFFEGKPAAKSGSPCTMCMQPGTLVGSASSVRIGG